jgi:hypothetical protein
MAIEDIDKMTAPLSRRGETQVASDPDPMAEKWDMYQDMIKDGSYTGTWEDFLLDFEDAVDIPYAKRKEPQGIMQLAGGLDAEEMMDRAYKWYHENHIKGIEGFESPLYDEDGIPLIDPSTIFTMFMSS